MESIFFEIGTIIVIAALLAYVARLLKQPFIPAYILAGILIGPLLGFVTNADLIYTLAEIGIAFLLFIVGLEIDISKLRDVGSVAIVGGLLQMVLTFGVALFASFLLGFSLMPAIYIGLVIAFSSTMVVIKILSDKRAIDTLHSRIIIGILLMQDIVAIFALSALSSVGQITVPALVLSLGKGLFVVALAAVIGRYALPPIFRIAARSQELLFITALSVCFLFAFMFTSMAPLVSVLSWFTPVPQFVFDFFTPGFSFTIGAFAAGVVLGNLPYNFEIISKVRPIKDFFSIIFFVSLGMQLAFAEAYGLLMPLVVLLLLVVLIKPVILMTIISIFGYKKRTSFLSSIYMAQVSEFAFVIILQGFLLGHLQHEILTLTVMLAIFSIGLTPYLFKYDNWMYERMKWLSVFERLNITKREPAKHDHLKYDFILCGYNRIGYSLLKTAAKLNHHILVVDYNPEVIKSLIRQNISCIYGDVSDTHFLDEIDVRGAKMVISTVPDLTANLLLIKKAKSDDAGIVFVTASQIDEALKLYESGADYVILPHFLGGEHVSLLMEKTTQDISHIVKVKMEHIKELHHRRYLGHEHPY